MKFNKTKIVFIFVGISLALSIIHNFCFLNSKCIFNKNEEYISSNSKNLKQSSFLILSRIHIDGNWSYTAGNYTWCTGDGSWSNPYRIQGIKINGNNSGSCITIENTNDPFIITNCMLINASYYQNQAGIRLDNVNNGQIIENNCSGNNRDGIYINGFNNTISGNFINSNSRGIELSGNNHTISNNIIYFNNRGIQASGANHTISNNTISNNVNTGIFLQNLIHSKIKNNTLYNNDAFGIYMEESFENNITKNEISSHNSAGIAIQDSDWNIIKNNTIYDNERGISLDSSHNNDIIENTLNPNGIGIDMQLSNYNNIINNLIVYYYECISQTDCQDNNILDNDCQEKQRFKTPSIFGYDLILLITLLSIVSVFLLKTLKYAKKS
ncbi:MAG: nitrous oxide reductase family maturation protein NosD [Promethearchaeota archaeon]